MRERRYGRGTEREPNCGRRPAAAGALLALALLPGPSEPFVGDRRDHDANSHVWKPRTTSVAVFKNGLGFFMREGDVALREGWCMARELPPAAFGTLAVYSHERDEVVDIVGAGQGEVVEFDGHDAASDPGTKRKRLEALKDLNVQVTYRRQDDDRNAAGRLVSIGQDFVVLDGQNNSLAVPLAGIRKVQVLELPIRVHVKSDGDRVVDKTRLGMAYLSKGITWIPEYTLKIVGDDTAELTLRGTVVNEAEDLVHTDVHFVVGVPHFQHSEYLTPAAVGQIIRTIGAAVAPPGLQGQIMSRAGIASNAVGADQFEHGVTDKAVAGSRDVRPALSNLPQMDSPSAGSDYTVYTKKDLTVRKGEKAIVTLFVQKIRYSHLYRWSPPAGMEHSLVLQNETETAWTTGPCLAVSGQRPLSENLLRYTPKAGRCEFTVTTAVNVATDKAEREAARELKAYSPEPRVHLDLVTLEGKLKIRNFERRRIDVIVSIGVPGRPIDASDAGQLSVDTEKLMLRERAGSVRWEVKLEPDETKTLSYRYERYVPSN